jgi:hypothetical protein
MQNAVEMQVAPTSAIASMAATRPLPDALE